MRKGAVGHAISDAQHANCCLAAIVVVRYILVQAHAAESQFKVRTGAHHHARLQMRCI